MTGDTSSGGPAGKGDYRIKSGECVSSIAFEHGLFWETVWDHPDNAELKQLREDPNVLLEGDRLTVPELRPKQESGGTEERHRFRKKGVPAQIVLRFLEEVDDAEDQEPQAPAPADEDALHATTEDPEPPTAERRDEPRADVPYRLEIDGIVTEGETDSDGKVELSIPPDARTGTIVLEPGTPKEAAFPLNLGHLDPISELSGVRQRLHNLGFACEDESDGLTDDLRAALAAFQEKHGLSVTGDPDQETRDELKEQHGG